MYDPTLGRFLQRDPAGLAAGGANLYQYGLGRPSVLADPSGQKFEGGEAAENDFFDKLGRTEDQKKAIAALRKDAEFKKLWDYLRRCEVNIKLKVEPGLTTRGVERFGGYSQKNGFRINPTKKEHTANPIDLIDTIVHEAIHASQDCVLRDKKTVCPLGKEVLDSSTDPKLKALLDDLRKDNPLITPELKKYLEENYGDSASNPKAEFIDINKHAQKFIDNVLGRVKKESKVGK
jgi:uncharacterized protein RhaS with RHS repeats